MNVFRKEVNTKFDRLENNIQELKIEVIELKGEVKALNKKIDRWCRKESE